jgi:hypothetical protein
VVAERHQLAHVGGRLAGLHPPVEEAVDLQVRVSADRAGEVAVVGAGQGVVLVLDRRVGGLLEAPQEGVVDGGALGLVGGLVQDALQLEAVLEPPQRVSEDVGETGERGQLLLVGGRVDAAQERHPEPAEVLGDRLVGGQHELLDDLVAQVVGGEVGAGDLAVGVVLQHRLRHGQLQRAALQPLLAEQ